MVTTKDRETERLLLEAVAKVSEKEIRPPDSLLYEDMLAGACLTWRYDIPECDVLSLQSALDPEDISSLWHRAVIAACISLFLEVAPVDWVRISEMIRPATGNSQGRDLQLMEECLHRNGIGGNEAYYVERITLYAHARRLQVALAQCAARLSCLDEPYPIILSEIKRDLREALRFNLEVKIG